MFASPMFLWALAAAAIPLMLHMFQRRRTVRVPFPTLRFLKAAQKRSSSRVRFENFLLWLLRTLLIIALALAFAEPVLRNASGGAFARTSRDVALVIDASYSMDYGLDRGTAWSRSIEAAKAVVEKLEPGDRVCLRVAHDKTEPAIEKLTAEHATVLAALEGLEPGEGASRLEDACASAMHELYAESDRREKELFVFTDGQASPWRGFRSLSDADAARTGEAAQLSIPREWRDSTDVYLFFAGAANPDNAAVTEVAVSPLLPLVGQTIKVKAAFGRTGPARQTAATLLVDGKERGSRSVQMEPGAAPTAEFTVDGLEEGVHLAEVRLPRDALPDDDVFELLLRVSGRLPVLVCGSSEATRFLVAALAPGGAREAVKTVSAAELEAVDLRDFRAVFLCDAFPLSGQAALKLETYAQAGGVVAIFPGDSCDAAAYGALNILPAAPQETLSLPANLGARQLRRVPMRTGATVNFSMTLAPGTIPTLAVKRLLTFGDLRDDASILVETADGSPFLIGRAAGRGRVFIFAVSATREWSTFPLTAFFVPFVHQIVRQGAGATVQPPSLVLGTTVPAEEAISQFRETDEIRAPNGSPLLPTELEGHAFVFESLPQIGIYTRAQSGGEPVPVMAVNADRGESELSTVSSAEVAEWAGFAKMLSATDGEELQRLVDEHRNGRAFTEPVLWLAFLLALVEWWVSGAVLRSRKGAIEDLKVSLSGKVS